MVSVGSVALHTARAKLRAVASTQAMEFCVEKAEPSPGLHGEA